MAISDDSRDARHYHTSGYVPMGCQNNLGKQKGDSYRHYRQMALADGPYILPT